MGGRDGAREPSSRYCGPPPRRVDECANDGLAPAITAAGDAAVVALEKPTEQLDVLADAGAVDADGRGLLVLLDALRSTITGSRHPPARCTELSPTALPQPEAPRRPRPPQFPK